MSDDRHDEERHDDLPENKRDLRQRAVRIEWLTIVYFISAIVVLYLTLGNSQAMKTAWAEDILSLVPPIAFLVASRFRHRHPNERYPYGYHRSITIAYLTASLALFSLGAILFLDSVTKLIRAEHPSIGIVSLFGHEIWLGWLMIAALLWGVIPPVFLGRAKIPLSRELHDKALYADAEMNRADWLTGSAAILGILGVGVGFWWADGVAASIISLDILRDGYKNLVRVVGDLMDRVPMTIERAQRDPLPARLEGELRKLPWVRDAKVRLREEGHVFYGEAFVIPSDEADLIVRIEEASESLRSLDWRLHRLVIVPRSEIPDDDRLG